MAKSAELETQSYWEDSASVSRYPALDRSLSVDVVVIGAGITGSMFANRNGSRRQ